MLVFAHVHSYDKSFPIDYPLLFCFNRLQGYAPFSDLFTNSPVGFKSRKSIAFFKGLYHFLQYSKLYSWSFCSLQ
jgi:hypothetical protein